MFDLPFLRGYSQEQITQHISTPFLLPRVLTIGPSLTEKGGIGRVSSLIVDRVPRAKLNHISSWNNVPNSSRLPNKLTVTYYFALAWLRLVERLWNRKLDILHCHMAERGCTLRTAIFASTAYAFNIPVIIHTHGAEFQEFYQALPPRLQQELTRIFQRASCIIVLSESWQKYYVEQFQLPPHKVNLLYNPVECPADLTPKDDTQTFKLLFLGQVKPRKGIYDLLDSIAAIKNRWGITIKLLLAGDGEIAAVVKKAEKLGIVEDIEVLGWIDLEEKNRRLQEADCFVLPSYNEGLPMALLEAMSYGLPIITTPVGGIGEVITNDENGLLVQPGAIEQLTNALRLLISDRDLRLRLGNNAMIKAREFAIDKYTDSLSTLYEKIATTNHN